MVLGAGRPHEHGRAVAVLGDHLEAERLAVEGRGPARVAHVEHGVVEPRTVAVMTLRNPLRRSTIPGNTSTKRSTSAVVDDQPTETRSERSASTPIAASTGDGSSVSDEHAEPECTATPCWSSASRIGSASTPSTPRHNRFGQRRRVAEALDAGDRRRRPSAAALDERALRARPRASRSTAAHAAPNPTHAGTFSMPPRRARSCAPPTSNGGTRRPRRTSSAPAPIGPPSLCAVTEQRSAPSAAKSTAHVTRRRARVDVHEHAALARAPRTTSAAGCTRADLVVGELHLTRARCRGAPRRRPRRRRTGRAGRRRRR